MIASRRLRSWAAVVVASVVLAGTAGAQSGGNSASPVKSAAKAAKATEPAKAATSAKGASAPPGIAEYAQRYASLCAACHGANGRSEMPGTPALAGQHAFYSITQLFLFREGRRNNEAMTAVAKTMNDADLRGFSNFIDSLPPVPSPPPATPTDPARMARGQSLAQQHKCLFCHGADFAGGQQVPRIAGQREDYLRETLRGYKSGTRPAYTMAMIAAVSETSPEDLDTLAYYASRFPTPAPSAAGKSP